MQTSEDRAYYQKREADERIAAEKADAVAKRAHEGLANLYAARLREEPIAHVVSAA
jgi:hypothetical protein